MDPVDYNKHAWDAYVEKGNRWTLPVDSEQIAAARRGDWQIVLTARKPIPRDWFPPLAGARVLCLAGSGGQQAPILAAAGAVVTVFDNSPRQLARDREVAERDGLKIETVEGDMRDLSAFPEASFDLVVNPCSLTFVPDIRPVFREVARVLRPGGRFFAGFVHAFSYVFDEEAGKAGRVEARHVLPYSDEKCLPPAEFEKLLADREALIFSHGLEETIGGQLAAGLQLRDLYEDAHDDMPLAKYCATMFATYSLRPVTDAPSRA